MTRHTVFSTGPLKGAATGLAALLAFAAFAWAGAQDDCAQKDDRGLRIDACTEMINSDEFSSRERAVAHFNRGSARDSLGDIPGAIEDYDAALRLDPEMGAAYYNRANAYFSLDDYAKAIKDYDQAVRIDPAAALAHNNRGEAYSLLGDDKRALEDFSQALRIDPTYADAYRNRGVVYENMGRFDRAVSDWDQEIQLGGAERARWWQEYLTAKGHYSGEIDGINSPAVWAALTACAVDPDC
jgi:tetratricopeptide (TPR) repeat protein